MRRPTRASTKLSTLNRIIMYCYYPALLLFLGVIFRRKIKCEIFLLFQQTLFALASSYSETTDVTLRTKAITLCVYQFLLHSSFYLIFFFYFERFEQLAMAGYEAIRVNFALAILYTDTGDFNKAANSYRAVLDVSKNKFIHWSSF